MSKSIDHIIKELIKEKIDSTPIPPSVEAWNEIKSKLRKEKKHIAIKRLRLLFATCIVFLLLLSVFVLNIGNFQAFANNLIKSIKDITENTFKIHKSINYHYKDELERIDNPKVKV